MIVSKKSAGAPHQMGEILLLKWENLPRLAAMKLRAGKFYLKQNQLSVSQKRVFHLLVYVSTSDYNPVQ